MSLFGFTRLHHAETAIIPRVRYTNLNPDITYFDMNYSAYLMSSQIYLSCKTKLILVFFRLLILGGAVNNLQSVSLLGIRSHLPSISYAFQLITFLKYRLEVGLPLLKRNGSRIARKVPSNVTYSTFCFNIHTLISDVLIPGYINSQLYKCLSKLVEASYFSLLRWKMPLTLFYNNREVIFELKCHYFRVK